VGGLLDVWPLGQGGWGDRGTVCGEVVLWGWGGGGRVPRASLQLEAGAVGLGVCVGGGHDGRPPGVLATPPPLARQAGLESFLGAMGLPMQRPVEGTPPGDSSAPLAPTAGPAPAAAVTPPSPPAADAGPSGAARSSRPAGSVGSSHVFVVQSDAGRLACDAVAAPFDTRSGLQHWKPLPPAQAPASVPHVELAEGVYRVDLGVCGCGCTPSCVAGLMVLGAGGGKGEGRAPTRGFRNQHAHAPCTLPHSPQLPRPAPQQYALGIAPGVEEGVGEEAALLAIVDTAAAFVTAAGECWTLACGFRSACLD
jgi:hypothetical protein